MEKLEPEEGKIQALPDLFAWTNDGVRLQSAKCATCGTHFFPASHQQHKPGCSREGVEEVLLSQKGKLASYAIQHYMCPPPFKTMGDISPYGIAMVEFPEGIQITGLIVDSDLEKLKVGQEVETTTYTLYKNEDGVDMETWAFRVIQ